jgi:hypothetical protein
MNHDNQISKDVVELQAKLRHAETRIDYLESLGSSQSHMLHGRNPLLSTNTTGNGSDNLLSGGALQPGESLISKNGFFHLVMEPTGNLSLWQVGRLAVCWQTNTWSPPSSLNMAPDGNLMVINYSSAQGRVVWSSNTSTPNSAFQVLNNGDLIVWGPLGPTWDSGPIVRLPTPTPVPTPMEQYCCSIGRDDGSFITKTILAQSYADASNQCSDYGRSVGGDNAQVSRGACR